MVIAADGVKIDEGRGLDANDEEKADTTNEIQSQRMGGNV